MNDMMERTCKALAWLPGDTYEGGKVVERHKEIVRTVVEAIIAGGFAIVPRSPTQHMIDEAWADALEEDARAVWIMMLKTGEITAQE